MLQYIKNLKKRKSITLKIDYIADTYHLFVIQVKEMIKEIFI